MPSLLPRRTLAAGAIAAALVAPFWTAAPAEAQRFEQAAPVAVAERNAALGYWRAFAMMHDDLTRLLDEASESMTAATFNPSPELREAVAEAEPVVSQLIRAAASKSCDFGVERDLGIGALLPHLQPMRSANRLLLVDARMQSSAGEEAAAAERLAAAFRMAEHAAQDGFVISSLVSVAMWNQSRLVTETLLDAGALAAESRATIRAALAAYPAGDPFHAEAALRGEADTLVNWLRTTINETGGGDGLASALGGDQAGLDFATIKSLDEAALQSHVDLMRAAYAQVLAAWDSPDPQAALNKVNEEVQAGAFGELARILLPALNRYHQNVHKANADFTALRDRLAE